MRCRQHARGAPSSLILRQVRWLWRAQRLQARSRSEAKSALEAVVRITPENLEAQRLLADIYTADGEQAAALHCLGIVSSLEAMLPEPVMPCSRLPSQSRQ